jgi:ribosomal protein L23
VAARSAAVIVEPTVNPGDNGSESDVKTVARMALGMWQTAIFNVKVVKVATQNRKGKPRRTRFRGGITKDWKKAIVTLDAEHRINFF